MPNTFPTITNPRSQIGQSPCRFTVPGRHTDSFGLANQHYQLFASGDACVEQTALKQGERMFA